MKGKKKEPEAFFYELKNKEVGLAYSDEKIKEDDLLSQEEKAIGQDLYLEYQKVSSNFEEFLNLEYMRFDYRMNNCMLNRCYNNIFAPRDKIKACSMKCQEGTEALNSYISRVMEETNDEVASCLQKAQENANQNMEDSFKCYKAAIEKFGSLKKIIAHEFSYYKS